MFGYTKTGISCKIRHKYVQHISKDVLLSYLSDNVLHADVVRKLQLETSLKATFVAFAGAKGPKS